MKKHSDKILKLLTFSVVVVLAALFASTEAMAADNRSADSTVCAVIDGGDFKYNIYAHRSGTDNYLYLPKTVDASALTLMYTGNGNLTYEGDVYMWGDTFEVDASSGVVTMNISGIGQYRLRIMTGGNISSVYIELDGGDDAFRAVCADKSHEEPGELYMTSKDGAVLYSGTLEKFKGHGFTSFMPSWDTNFKNSYNIKLGEKAELVSGSGKIKKWVLLSPRMYDGSRDRTGLSQLMAYRTYTGLVGDRYFGMEGEYVDLYVNGDYRGTYILCERMNDGGAIDVKNLDDEVIGEGRLMTVNDRNDPAIELGIQQYTYSDDAVLSGSDVDISGGYVLEVMFGTYEGCGFKTANGVYFNIKSPEFCTQEMVQYIASEVQGFENAIFSETGYNSDGRHYTEYADMESLADMVLVYAYYQNFEYFRTSTYIYKDSDGEEHDKLTFGPVWDFETTARELSQSNTFFDMTFTYFNQQQFVWSEQLWQHGDFMATMYRENEKMRSSLDTLLSGVNTIISDVSPSQEMSTHRWGSEGYDSAANDYVNAAETRYDVWFDRLWGDGYLLYVDVLTDVNEDGTITMTADVGGTYSGQVTWYVLNSSDPTSFKLYNNRSDSITVPSDGSSYFCMATGNNNAHADFTPGAIFSSRTVMMRSAPIKADAESLTPQKTEPETTPATEPENNNGEGGCGSSVAAVYIAAAAVTAALIFRKRKKYNQ